MQTTLQRLAKTASIAAKPRNIMQQINTKSIQELDTDGRASLPLKPGSIVVVESFTSPAKTNTASFAGVLISHKRKGIDTSFTLRNIVLKNGVEMRYALFSPMIKSIKVLSQGNERRAKLYYLRDAPAKAFRSMLNKS